ncbi:MAG: Asp-tRNA(Asn)/Glu-tRNA(Gln) amidotransferase subunit GatC [bacterium]
MQRVSIEEVDHIAELARLDFSPEEKLRLAEDMDRILAMMETLKEVDTTNVEPLHHVLDLHTVLREDIPGETLRLEEALGNAPARRGDFFLVPKVISTDE